MKHQNDASLESLLASIRASLSMEPSRQQFEQPALPAVPFITISRQAGARGRTLARLLAAELNRGKSEAASWTVWDRELVEKVSFEQHIPESLIESLDGPRRSWLESLRSAVLPGGQLDEFQVYRRVALIVRGLARAGRVIIVGRGGVYATHDLPGGVHLRLIAPLEYRIEHMA